MRMLIATAGVLSPDPVAYFAERLVGSEGSVRVITVIEVPRSFLDQIRGEVWHPLSDSPSWSTEEDALIARYVEERGHRLTDPLLAALRARGIEATVTYLEGEDPADTILAAAEEMRADVVVLGATKHLFAEWESVSAAGPARHPAAGAGDPRFPAARRRDGRVSVEARRTPDERFAASPVSPSPPTTSTGTACASTTSTRVPGRPVVLFHGEPTWCFLYRKVAAAACRRLPGDRPRLPRVRALRQAGGPGLLHLRPPYRGHGRRGRAPRPRGLHRRGEDSGGPSACGGGGEPGFARLAVLNTSLFAGPPSEGFLRWRAFAARGAELPVAW